MDIHKTGSSKRRSTRLILQKLCRPTDGPIHINLEEHDEQLNDNVEGKNLEDDTVPEPETEETARGKSANITPTSSRKRLKKLGLQKDKPQQIDSKTSHHNSDDDFMDDYIIQTVTRMGTIREGRSKKASDNPNLTPDAIALKEKPKIKRVKVRAKRPNFYDEDEDEDLKKKRKRKSKSRLIDEETDADENNDAEKVPNKKKKKKEAEADENNDAEKVPNKKRKKKEASKANITDEFKIRNSPKTLTEMVTALSEQQLQWVRRNGFEHLLEFNLDKIPHRLASSVLNAFNADKCSLDLKSGSVKITEQDVYNVLGLPIGERILTVATENTATGESREDLWKQQFLKPNITTSNVIDRIRGGEADDLFKINFLMVLANVLIERQTGSYVHREILSFDINLDECDQYNWGEYLLRCLVKTKKNYKTSTASLFYTGPIIFLIIFYVDRVMYKGHRQVERQFPAFKGWTLDHLKKRQAHELKDGKFGTGYLTRRWQENQEEAGNEPLASAAQQTNEERREDEDGNETFNSAAQEKYQHREEDWFASLNVKANNLINALEVFQAEMQAAKIEHPKDEKISDIENKVMRTIEQMKQSANKDSARVEKDDEIRENLNENEEVNEDVINTEEIDPDVLDMVELIEYIHSSQGVREMNMYMDEISVPSFSLGVEADDPVIDVCNDINKEHGDLSSVEKQPDDNEMKTPATEEQEQRPKREIKLAAAYLSPYVKRVIDVNAKYSTDEYAVWRWIIQKAENNTEHVFEYQDEFCIRQHMATLRPKENIYYSVVGIWATLMNEKETYKAPESPSRLFFSISLSIAPLDEENTEDVQYKTFADELDHFFARHPDKKIKDHDLIFFPILANEHYYLLCLNMKTKQFEVIDNIRHGKAVNKEYSTKINRLKNHFVRYLREKELTWLATSVDKMKFIFMKMSWQTLQNFNDCAIFLMRHMETYQGDSKNWETQLKSETAGQNAQLVRLRTKYAHAILTSHLNTKREAVLKEAKLLYNKIAKEGLMSIVIAASSKRAKRTSGRATGPGTILFPDTD